MYDLHTHSLLSDGVLLPSEIAARYQAAGFKAIAICDHADYSNIESLTDSILKFTNNWPVDAALKVLPGIELTHLPPYQFKPLAEYARMKGIKIIVGHGQTPAEPVTAGTNRAAIEAGIDILAHPGLISDDDVKLAKEKGVFLEVTARNGHNKANRHVAQQAFKFGAKLIIDTDSHLPEDIPDLKKIKQVAVKAGINAKQLEQVFTDVRQMLKSKGVDV